MAMRSLNFVRFPNPRPVRKTKFAPDVGIGSHGPLHDPEALSGTSISFRVLCFPTPEYFIFPLVYSCAVTHPTLVL